MTNVNTVRFVLYGPPDWLIEHTTARDRRTFGFWCLVAAVLLYPIFGDAVRYVGVLGLLGLVPSVTSETPVEEE